jgi:hypothetical protein
VERSGGGYALPVGNGEAEVVGVGLEVGTATGVAGVVGWVGLAVGVGSPEVGVEEAEAAPHPLSPLGTGTGVPVAPLVGTGLALALAAAVAVGVTQDGLVGEAMGSGVAEFPVGMAVGVPAVVEGVADAAAW